MQQNGGNDISAIISNTQIQIEQLRQQQEAYYLSLQGHMPLPLPQVQPHWAAVHERMGQIGKDFKMLFAPNAERQQAARAQRAIEKQLNDLRREVEKNKFMKEKLVIEKQNMSRLLEKLELELSSLVRSADKLKAQIDRAPSQQGYINDVSLTEIPRVEEFILPIIEQCTQISDLREQLQRQQVICHGIRCAKYISQKVIATDEEITYLKKLIDSQDEKIAELKRGATSGQSDQDSSPSFSVLSSQYEQLCRQLKEAQAILDKLAKEEHDVIKVSDEPAYQASVESEVRRRVALQSAKEDREILRYKKSIIKMVKMLKVLKNKNVSEQAHKILIENGVEQFWSV